MCIVRWLSMLLRSIFLNIRTSSTLYQLSGIVPSRYSLKRTFRIFSKAYPLVLTFLGQSYLLQGTYCLYLFQNASNFKNCNFKKNPVIQVSCGRWTWPMCYTSPMLIFHFNYFPCPSVNFDFSTFIFPFFSTAFHISSLLWFLMSFRISFSTVLLLVFISISRSVPSLFFSDIFLVFDLFLCQ